MEFVQKNLTSLEWFELKPPRLAYIVAHAAKMRFPDFI
jgi:hypothetical protein